MSKYVDTNRDGRILMIKFIMITAILLASVIVGARTHTIDISFIHVNGKSTVEIVRDDMIYQIPLTAEDLELSPDEIVRKVCKETKLCPYDRASY